MYSHGVNLKNKIKKNINVSHLCQGCVTNLVTLDWKNIIRFCNYIWTHNDGNWSDKPL